MGGQFHVASGEARVDDVREKLRAGFAFTWAGFAFTSPIKGSTWKRQIFKQKDECQFCELEAFVINDASGWACLHTTGHAHAYTRVEKFKGLGDTVFAT